MASEKTRGFFLNKMPLDRDFRFTLKLYFIFSFTLYYPQLYCLLKLEEENYNQSLW